MATENPLFDQIKSRIILSRIVGQSVKLKRAGHEYTGLCPFHGEKTPSFTVNDQKEFYHCFGCGAHGNIFDFLMATEKLSFKESLARAAEIAGIILPTYEAQKADNIPAQKRGYHLMRDAALFFHNQLKLSSGHTALAYLKNRAVSLETIQKFQLGYAPDLYHAAQTRLTQEGYTPEEMAHVGLISENESGQKYDKFRNRVMFPIHDTKGHVVGFGGRSIDGREPKYLNSPDTPLFHKRLLLYNYHRAAQSRQNTPLVVCEGYMDVVALSQAGYEKAVCAMGTAVTADQIQLAWRLETQPTIVMDGDAAGDRAIDRIITVALPLLKPNYTLKFLRLPRGEDPDSLVQHQGITAFTQQISQAESLFRVLWHQTVGKQQPQDSPEAKAFYANQLQQAIRSIENTEVRHYYQQEAKKELFQATRFSIKKNTAPKLQAKSVANFRQIQEKTLLAIFLSAPALLREFEEAVALLEFCPPYNSLQTAFLDYLEHGLENESLSDYMHKTQLNTLTQSVSVTAMHPHAPYLVDGDETFLRVKIEEIIAARLKETEETAGGNAWIDGETIRRNY